jgi:hypothetical protein
MKVSACGGDPLRELRGEGVLGSTSTFKSSRKSVNKLPIIGHLRDALYVLGLVD